MPEHHAYLRGVIAPTPADRPSTAIGDRRDLRRWIVAVSIGEGVGFAIAAGVAVLTIVAAVPDPARFALIIGGGAVEGAALAIGQYLGMRQRRPRIIAWIVATAVAAAFAWALGMLPSTLGLDLAAPAVIAMVVGGGVALLAVIPVAQWLVLARPGAFRWVPVSVGAWAVAILWTFAPSPFIDEHSSLTLVVILYVLAGALMAVTFALLTAGTAHRLFGSTA